MDTAIFQGNLVRSDRIVYTPSSFAKANLIYLQETGRLEALEPHTSQREHLASYLFFLVEKGEGTVHFGGRQFQLTAGDCAFLDCSTPYSHRSSENLWALRPTSTAPECPASTRNISSGAGPCAFPPAMASSTAPFSRKFMRLPPPSCTSGI